MEAHSLHGDDNDVGHEDPGSGEITDELMHVDEGQVHSTTVLDEHSLQQLVESGTVSEDSIIAIVHNENGEPQTVVLSRQDAEALGIQLDPVEQHMDQEELDEHQQAVLLEQQQQLEQQQLEQEQLEQLEQQQLEQQQLEQQHLEQQHLEQQQLEQQQLEQQQIEQQQLEQQQLEQQHLEQQQLEQQQLEQQQLEQTQLEQVKESVLLQEPEPLSHHSPEAQELLDSVLQAQVPEHEHLLQNVQQQSAQVAPVVTGIITSGTADVSDMFADPLAAATTETKSMESAIVDPGMLTSTIPNADSAVTLESVTQQQQQLNVEAMAGTEAVGTSAAEPSANDVLSNIIHSLFNPNEGTPPNLSIVPRMVGGKRKLCLRLPASTASALLAQTGSPLATSFTEGGIPKKIKIVIPPSAMVGNTGAASLIHSMASTAEQSQKVIKVSVGASPSPITSSPQVAKSVQASASPVVSVASASTAAATAAAAASAAAAAGITTGPARLDPDSLPTNLTATPLVSSPPKSSSKAFLASLFNTQATTSTTTTTTSSPSASNANSHAPQSPVSSKKPLGSTENPIQLVQEGNSFRSLQPLTPDQLKHIAGVLKQNRQAILSGPGDNKSGNGSDSEGGKRRVVYDAASNTRIVYRVVTPGELKKSPTTASAIARSSSSNQLPVVKAAASPPPPPTPPPPAPTPIPVPTTTPSRGRGRGRGRPPRTSTFVPVRKPSQEESESEEPHEEEEREGKKKLLPRTRSGRVSKPPRHMVKDYKRLHHLDFAQPDLDDSDGGYSDYRVESGSADRGGTGAGDDSNPESAEDVKEHPVAHKNVIPTSPFHCTTCKREYTTPHRLSRHFEQFPDHSPTNLVSTQGRRSPAVSIQTTPAAAAIEKKNGQQEANEDVEVDTETESPAKAVRGRGGWRGGRGRGRGKGRGRGVGRPPNTPSPALLSEKRKIRLAEALEHCTDEEVVEVAGPRLAAAMASWEYLLLRVQQEDEGNSTAPLIPRILNEVTSLMDKVAAVAARHLHVHRLAGDTDQQEAYSLSNAKTARLVGLPCGTYFISKDDRKLLDEDVNDVTSLEEPAVVTPVDVTSAGQLSAVPVMADTTTASVASPMEDASDVKIDVDPASVEESVPASGPASSLWEELEEATQLPPVGSDDATGDGSHDGHGNDDEVESELMQVDEIVNQVVERTGGSQAPSPL